MPPNEHSFKVAARQGGVIKHKLDDDTDDEEEIGGGDAGGSDFFSPISSLLSGFGKQLGSEI